TTITLTRQRTDRHGLRIAMNIVGFYAAVPGAAIRETSASASAAGTITAPAPGSGPALATPSSASVWPEAVRLLHGRILTTLGGPGGQAPWSELVRFGVACRACVKPPITHAAPDP